MVNIKQGDEITLSFEVTDEMGVAFDLTTATDIIASLIVNEVIVSTFSLVVNPAYETLTVVNNKVVLPLTRTITKAYPIGVLKSAVYLKDTNREFLFELGEVNKGYTKNLIF